MSFLRHERGIHALSVYSGVARMVLFDDLNASGRLR
jgi:hypothetical protein